VTRLGVVVPCFRQEAFLGRTLAALETALAGRDWRGAIVISEPGADEDGVALGRDPRWSVIMPPVARPLTPGAARMLGFAAVRGEAVLFVDADVEIERAWLARALEIMELAPGVAGVGGRLEEWIVDRGTEWAGSEDLNRVGRRERRVDHLTTPALYRRTALVAAGGYDARLNSEEDFELGLRCAAAGLELRTLAPLAGRHWSGPRPSLAEIGRRWRAGLCFGMGQVLRIYLGRPGFGRLLARQRLYLVTLAMWSMGVAALVLSWARRDARLVLLWLALAAAAWAAMSVRKRSPRLGAHSLLTWSVNALGLVVGFVRPDAGFDDGGMVSR
jgi:hypothetical protein